MTFAGLINGHTYIVTELPEWTLNIRCKNTNESLNISSE